MFAFLTIMSILIILVFNVMTLINTYYILKAWSILCQLAIFKHQISGDFVDM